MHYVLLYINLKVIYDITITVLCNTFMYCLSLGCYDKMPYAGWLEQHIYSAQYRRLRGPRSRWSQFVLGEGPLRGLHGRERESAGIFSSSYKGTNSIMGGLYS